MNPHTIPYDLPPGTLLKLAEDDNGVTREIYGYEWTVDGTYLIFRDGGKLNMTNTHLITQILKKGEPTVTPTNDPCDRGGDQQK